MTQNELGSVLLHVGFKTVKDCAYNYSNLIVSIVRVVDLSVMHNYGSAVAEHDAHPYLTQKITAESDSLYSFLNNPLSFNNTHFLGLKYSHIRPTDCLAAYLRTHLPNLYRKDGGFDQWR
jgi:hypothetical protein